MTSKADMIDIIEEVAKMKVGDECKNKEKRGRLIGKAQAIMDELGLTY